jgi:hypothetical protein
MPIMLKFSCMLHLYPNVWDKFKFEKWNLKIEKELRKENEIEMEKNIQRKIYTYIHSYNSSW